MDPKERVYFPPLAIMREICICVCVCVYTHTYIYIYFFFAKSLLYLQHR